MLGMFTSHNFTSTIYFNIYSCVHSSQELSPAIQPPEKGYTKHTGPREEAPSDHTQNTLTNVFVDNILMNVVNSVYRPSWSATTAVAHKNPFSRIAVPALSRRIFLGALAYHQNK